jgi:dehydrogenase/reductase SDR family member 7B
MLDAVDAGEREIIVAEGIERVIGEARRTPDELFDQIAELMAGNYMDMMEADD